MPASTKISIECPACHAGYHVPAETAGRKVRCVTCRHTFRIDEKLGPASEDEILRWLMEDPEEDIVPRPRRARVAAEAAPTDTKKPGTAPGDRLNGTPPRRDDPLAFRRTG